MRKASIQLQREFSGYLRNPEKNTAPQGVEDRRLQIYRDLIYNNIESFIANGFPILRQLYSDVDWRALACDFIEKHQSHSPYFLKIGAEFIDYLSNERTMLESDPAFLLELANYEWAELALFVSDEKLPVSDVGCDPFLMDAIPRLSPLAWPMVFSFPVHKIGVGFQPKEPEPAPVCLVVYRNRGNRVGFLEINPVTARLLEICEANETHLNSRELLRQIAGEIPGAHVDTLLTAGEAILAQLRNLDIIYFTKH